ncbi:hypothetical protein PC9H_008905 [Pleurotus ostreatus]|uniref:Uncharacterized protein n=1 Tax=Pleurotus ostreatus TaxID=5322 RepID=A0A8H6ZU21_PLEOS|nr:uncharacterized protein PC9H_008905 [Pleurotus ostreatus]KAF7426536.1 hypothetical protein PC9H_008905 [Pleurotus ostreatus]
MDSFYDKAKAVQTLEQLIAERTEAASSPQMYRMDSEATEKFNLSIRREVSDTASRLTQCNEDTGEAEEATVAIQGIICGAKLPPFETWSSRPEDAKRLAHSRQSVTLTGLGSQSFEHIVENCRRAYSMFSRYTPNARLVPSPEFLGRQRVGGSDDTDEYSTITASNRFFTPSKQAAGLTVVDINSELDPRGILEKVDKTKWLHTEDNAVDYYVLSTGDNGSRHLPTAPIVFQIGDLVELQASLICIPNKGNFTVKLILRSMILLNSELTTQATTARTLIGPAATPVLRRLKRRNPSHGSAPYPRIDANNNDKSASVAVDAVVDIAEDADTDNSGRDECMDN